MDKECKKLIWYGLMVGLFLVVLVVMAWIWNYMVVPIDSNIEEYTSVSSFELQMSCYKGCEFAIKDRYTTPAYILCTKRCDEAYNRGRE